jgi:uncharacterized protein
VVDVKRRGGQADGGDAEQGGMTANRNTSMRAPSSATTSFAFHVIAKPAGPACNLACSYCFYREKEGLYPTVRRFVMTDEVLDAFIRQYIEAQDVPVVSFTWQGGEPTLLGVDYFRRVVELEQRYANGKRIENAFQTNGTLLDDEWAEFLAEERFLVGISIDGPATLNDRWRLDHAGRATLARVLSGLAALKRHRVEFNTLTCIQRQNAERPLDVYRFLRELGAGFMQFIPVVELRADSQPEAAGSETEPDGARVTEWSVGPEQYGRFLCTVFEEWVRRDVGRIFVQSFEVALAAWMGQDSSLCLFRPTCGLALVVEHNGDVYACDHFVDQAHRLGNLTQEPLIEMVRGETQTSFGREKARLPSRCETCDMRFACHGGCPKQRFVRDSADGPRANYLCPSYETFLRYADPYMRFMADELTCGRSAAGVMTWAREQQRSSLAKARPAREAFCSCGSGRKYRACCGR